MAKMKNKLPVAKSTSIGVEAGPRPYKPSKEDQNRERRYRAEDALRDIERAKKHEGDKQLMSDVKALAKEKIQDLTKVAGKK